MMRIGSAIRRVLALALCVLLGCGAFAGCSQVDDIVSNVTAAGVFPVEVNGVTISSRPSRVVVLSPSLADVILALGCETQLAGASEGCTQSALDELEKVSADSVEAIQALQPDLVLVDPNSSGAQSALEEAGVTVLSVEPATDRSDFEYDEGIATAQDIFITLDNINRIVPKDTITTACYLYDLDGSAVTGDMFGSTIMSYAGVTNVFESLEGGTYDFQSLEIANPNVIFCAPGLKEQIESDSRFADFQAVQQGNVVEMDESLMSSSSVSDPTQDIESQVSSALEAQAQYETLEQGDQGDSVQALQERLTQLGYLTDPYDGMYGSTTADCVSRFQTANGLEATGIADPATQAALFASGALREDGTPLPEESGESSTSQSSSSTSESSASASESSASESSSQASSASSASESSSQASASQ